MDAAGGKPAAGLKGALGENNRAVAERTFAGRCGTDFRAAETLPSAAFVLAGWRVLDFKALAATFAALRARFAAFFACLKALRACLCSALIIRKCFRAASASFSVAIALAMR